MRQALLKRYQRISDAHVAQTLKESGVVSGVGSVAKVFRQVLQSAALGLGAYLATGERSAPARSSRPRS